MLSSRNGCTILDRLHRVSSTIVNCFLIATRRYHRHQQGPGGGIRIGWSRGEGANKVAFHQPERLKWGPEKQWNIR